MNGDDREFLRRVEIIIRVSAPVFRDDFVDAGAELQGKKFPAHVFREPFRRDGNRSARHPRDEGQQRVPDGVVQPLRGNVRIVQLQDESRRLVGDGFQQRGDFVRRRQRAALKPVERPRAGRRAVRFRDRVFAEKLLPHEVVKHAADVVVEKKSAEVPARFGKIFVGEHGEFFFPRRGDADEGRGGSLRRVRREGNEI